MIKKQSNCPNWASFFWIRGESIPLLAVKFTLTVTKSAILIKKMMESVNNQGKFQETESIFEEIFIFLHSTSYLKLLLVGLYWSQLSNMKYHQKIWIRLRETCSPQNIIVKFPATVIVGGAAQIKNTKVRVYFIKCNFEWFFFSSQVGKTRERRETRSFLGFTRVFTRALFVSRVLW